MNSKSANTIDLFAQKVHHYRQIKTTYESQKAKLRQSIQEIELQYAESILKIDYYKEHIEIVPITTALKKQLLPIFVNRNTLLAMLLKKIANPQLIRDFNLMFPGQLSLLKDLFHQKQSLKPFYQELLHKRHQKTLFGLAVQEAIGILERYGEAISVDFMVSNEKKQENYMPTLNKLHSQPEVKEPRDLGAFRKAMHKSLEGLPTSKIKTLRDLQTLDEVITSIIENLSKNIHAFRMQLRFMLSLMKSEELKQAKLEWISIIEAKLLQDNCFQVYTLNCKIVTYILKSLVQKHNANFANSDIRQFYAAWYFKMSELFRRLLEINYDDEYITEYESKRTLCLISYQTLSILPLSPPIPPTPNCFLLFNTIDIVSSLYQQSSKIPRPPIVRSNFIRLENEAGWADLLQIVTKDRQDLVGEECNRICRMIEDIEESYQGMGLRARHYLEFLEKRIKSNEILRKYIQKHEKDSKVHDLWTNMIVQQGINLVVEDRDIYFSTEGKGCSVSCLSKYIQYVGLSTSIADKVHNSIQLDKLNHIYCDYLALTRARILVQCGNDDLFTIVKEKIEASLFHNWQIGEGPSCKDLVALRGMESQTVYLKDLDLEKFADEQNYYVSLAASEFERLAHTTSPVEIVDCFLQMSNKVQYTMKLSRPQVILAGDAQLSITYFLISRYRLPNFASLLNFIQVCWYSKADYGQHQYMLTVLKSVLQLLVQTRQNSFDNQVSE